MAEYAKLIEALRICAGFVEDPSCAKCAYSLNTKCKSTMMQDAAAAIEALWSENEILHAHIEDMNEVFRDKSVKIEELKAEQKKTVTQIFGEEQMAWEGRCKDLMKQISELQAEVKILKVSGREAYFEGLSVGAEPKMGKWVRVEDEESYHYECSRCGERPLYSRYGDVVLSGVCPMCGKKMEVQE